MAKKKLLAREIRKDWGPKDVAMKMQEAGKASRAEKTWDSESTWLHRGNGCEEPSMPSSFESFYK